MQKLKYTVLNKMIAKNLTSAEINFILHISHYQDDAGNVLGVYYKEIIMHLHISIQKFYDLLESLEKKNIIRVIKNYYSDWDIQILDNDFTDMENALREGYLSTQHNIFYSSDFLRLKAGEKLLAMSLLKINFTREVASYTKSGTYCIGVKKFYDTYASLMGKSKRIIQNYLTKLRKWFSIGIKEHLYYITPLQRVYKNGTPMDAEAYEKHIGGVACRRERLIYTKETFKDAAALASQFVKQIKAPLMGKIFLEAVKESIERSNERQKNKRQWKRILQPKLINKCIVERIMNMEF